MRAISVLLFLAGLALLASRETVGFGVVMAVGGAVLWDRSDARSAEDTFIAGLLLVGVVGAGAVIWSYLTALL